ncbi:SDR family oxidoreductase [Campylobacter insulaenigrae]|uniref:SDR family oxidoreductase n=1 Tax=Campylobacter insulaenigrae TaxID=260714 RepID=UPI002152992D|nr:SDR family oxidoreductase [Campylobacter insulaenigrae]MCR6587603.1 SDR family oxidoreductase [Campylobacter insulaenigrae]
MQKIIIITGSRKGIGKELSEYYLKKNYIVCGCSRGKTSIKHENYRHFELDVCDEKAVVSMTRNIKKEFGKIDILINNAGIAAMNHILTTPFKSLENIFKTNFFGSFLFIREVSKIMNQTYKKETTPMPYRIVNFSTVAVALRLEGEAIYAASKAAICNLTQVCAKELSPFGITCNAIGPTPVPTDLIKNIPTNKIQDLLNKQAIKRFGNFQDITNTIDFFINEKSNFITGQVIYLGGLNE